MRKIRGLRVGFQLTPQNPLILFTAASRTLCYPGSQFTSFQNWVEIRDLLTIRSRAGSSRTLASK